jgi:hypothetical protein
MDDHARIKDLNKTVWDHRATPLSKSFVDFVADTQFPLPDPISVYPIPRHFSEKSSLASASIKDPVKFMQHILSRTSSPTLDHAFKARHTYLMNCSVCNAIIPTCDTDVNIQTRKRYQPPTTITEEDYLTTIAPEYTERELRYEGPSKRDLHALLLQNQAAENYMGCQKCGNKGAPRLKKTWCGFAYAPDVLTFAMDRSSTKKYRVTLPLEHDFTPFVVASGEKTMYRLVTVIKTLKSGDHAAFLHAEDGR